MNKREEALASSKLYRLIDANLNRLREGIRVCEDIQRYINDNKELSKKLKSIRHECRVKDQKRYLKSRDIIGDVLKTTTNSEAKRENINSIQIANIKRAQESTRVLEESLKLIDTKEAEKFKQIRYELYDIEKNMLQ
jgi:thiamine-phosphate pyrophosphorylase